MDAILEPIQYTDDEGDSEPESYDYHDSSVDDVPRHLRRFYADAMRLPHPFLLSNDQLKVRNDPVFWELRCVLVERLNRDLDEELVFLDHLFEYDTKEDPKWQHRRWIAKKLGNNARSKELEFTDKIIQKDSKNYHAWSHRQWVFQAFGGDLEDELAYCDKILAKDAYNIFAWDQRCTLMTKHCPDGDFENMKLLETNKAMSAIEDKPENECPWLYLRHLHKKDMTSLFRLDVDVQNVLLNLVNRAKALSEDADLDVSMMNKVGCMHALKLLLELMNHGYIPTRGMQDVIEVLYPKSGPLGLGYADKVRAIMESLDLPE